MKNTVNFALMFILMMMTTNVTSVFAQVPQMTKITDTPSSEYHLRWSPDGTKIAYVHQYSIIRILNIKEKTFEDIIPIHEGGDLYIAWLNNQEIIFDTRDPNINGKFDLWKSSISGGEQIPVKEHAHMPAVSPDGTKLIYQNQGKLYIMPASGGEAELLVSSESLDYFHPSWSQDGEQIVFSSISGENKDLWIISAAGDDLTQVTDDPGGEDRASWHPDGDKISYTSYDPANQMEQDVWIKNIITGHKEPLTSYPGKESASTWKMGEKIMAISSRQTGQEDIWLYDYSGMGIGHFDDNNNKPFAANISIAPNPFNPGTEISFSLKKDYEDFSIDIYDAKGSLVINIMKKGIKNGSHKISFNGEKLNSGTYFVRLTSNKILLGENKLTLLK